MNVQVEVSLYPLNTSKISEVVEIFLSDIEQSGLPVEKGNMSSQVAGGLEAVFSATAQAFKRIANHGQVVLVMKVSNACPTAVHRE